MACRASVPQLRPHSQCGSPMLQSLWYRTTACDRVTCSTGGKIVAYCRSDCQCCLVFWLRDSRHVSVRAAGSLLFHACKASCCVFCNHGQVSSDALLRSHYQCCCCYCCRCLHRRGLQSCRPGQEPSVSCLRCCLPADMPNHAFVHPHPPYCRRPNQRVGVQLPAIDVRSTASHRA
jgi:hypothetical protein